MKRMTLGVIAALALTACGGGDDGPAGDEDAVREAAEEHADRYSSGDFGGSWDMWASDAQDVISRDEFVAYAEECVPTGMPIEVSSVRLDSDTEATVRLGIGEVEQSYGMTLEDDEWRWIPTDEGLALYELGAEGAIEQAKSEGRCNA